jgi:hypothetical protein
MRGILRCIALPAEGAWDPLQARECLVSNEEAAEFGEEVGPKPRLFYLVPEAGSWPDTVCAKAKKLAYLTHRVGQNPSPSILSVLNKKYLLSYCFLQYSPIKNKSYFIDIDLPALIGDRHVICRTKEGSSVAE